MHEELEKVYNTYLLHLLEIQEAWQDVITDQLKQEFLLPTQKKTEFSDTSLMELFKIPFGYINKYEDFIVGLMFDLIGVESESKKAGLTSSQPFFEPSFAPPTSASTSASPSSHSSPSRNGTPRKIKREKTVQAPHLDLSGISEKKEKEKERKKEDSDDDSGSARGVNLKNGGGSVRGSREKAHTRSKSFERNNTVNVLNMGTWGSHKEKETLIPSVSSGGTIRKKLKQKHTPTSSSQEGQDKSAPPPLTSLPSPRDPPSSPRKETTPRDPSSSSSTNTPSPPPPTSVFTIHFPPNHKKSIVVSSLNTPIRPHIEKLCKVRGKKVEDFFVVDQSNNVVSLDTNFCDIAGNQVFMAHPDDMKEHRLFSIKLPSEQNPQIPAKHTILSTPDTTLGWVLSRVVALHQISPESHLVQYQLPISATIASGGNSTTSTPSLSSVTSVPCPTLLTSEFHVQDIPGLEISIVPAPKPDPNSSPSHPTGPSRVSTLLSLPVSSGNPTPATAATASANSSASNSTSDQTSVETERITLFQLIKTNMNPNSTITSTNILGFINSPINSYKDTCLHIAADKGDVHVVKILLKHGANASAQNVNLNTPLHTACIKKHHEIVQILLKKGANPGIPNVDGNTPLHYLARGKLNPKLRAILDDIVSPGSAPTGGKSSLLTNKYINYKNNNDETPLFCSVMSSDADVAMCEYLISAGATLDVKSKKNLTLVQAARISGKDDIIRLIEFATNSSRKLGYEDFSRRKTFIVVPKSTGTTVVKGDIDPVVMEEMKELWIAAKQIKEIRQGIRCIMAGKYVKNSFRTLDFQEKVRFFFSNFNAYQFGIELSDYLLHEGDISLKIRKKDVQIQTDHRYFLFENVLLLAGYYTTPNTSDTKTSKRMVMKYVLPIKQTTFSHRPSSFSKSDPSVSFTLTCTLYTTFSNSSSSPDSSPQLDIVGSPYSYSILQNHIDTNSGFIFGVPLKNIAKRFTKMSQAVSSGPTSSASMRKISRTVSSAHEKLLIWIKFLPDFLSSWILYLLKHAVSKSDILIPANSMTPIIVMAINSLKEKYDSGVPIIISEEISNVTASVLAPNADANTTTSTNNPKIVAQLFLHFLQCLPEPIIDFKVEHLLCSQFQNQASQFSDQPSEQSSAQQQSKHNADIVRGILSDVPTPHYFVLRALVVMLHVLSERFSSANANAINSEGSSTTGVIGLQREVAAAFSPMIFSPRKSQALEKEDGNDTPNYTSNDLTNVIDNMISLVSFGVFEDRDIDSEFLEEKLMQQGNNQQKPTTTAQPVSLASSTTTTTSTQISTSSSNASSNASTPTTSLASSISSSNSQTTSSNVPNVPTSASVPILSHSKPQDQETSQNEVVSSTSSSASHTHVTASTPSSPSISIVPPEYHHISAPALAGSHNHTIPHVPHGNSPTILPRRRSRAAPTTSSSAPTTTAPSQESNDLQLDSPTTKDSEVTTSPPSSPHSAVPSTQSSPRGGVSNSKWSLLSQFCLQLEQKVSLTEEKINNFNEKLSESETNQLVISYKAIKTAKQELQKLEESSVLQFTNPLAPVISPSLGKVEQARAVIQNECFIVNSMIRELDEKIKEIHKNVDDVVNGGEVASGLSTKVVFIKAAKLAIDGILNLNDL